MTAYACTNVDPICQGSGGLRPPPRPVIVLLAT